jgi:pteridine reductase
VDRPEPLAGRVALVTGAARRVGRAIALELARAGCDVAVHWRTSAAEADAAVAEIRALGRRAVAVRAELSSSAGIDALFADVDAAFGRLDVLVNSAAIFRRTPPEALTEADFDDQVAVNLKAPYLCSLRAAERMRRQGWGRIVNLADVAAERPMRNHVPYCVSKAGLVMLTRALALALAPDITVNAVAPGTVEFRDDEDEATRRAVIARIPRGRIGTPGDVARAVRYLCEDGEHVTGAILPVDGGRALA